MATVIMNINRVLKNVQSCQDDTLANLNPKVRNQ